MSATHAPSSYLKMPAAQKAEFDAPEASAASVVRWLEDALPAMQRACRGASPLAEQAIPALFSPLYQSAVALMRDGAPHPRIARTRGPFGERIQRRLRRFIQERQAIRHSARLGPSRLLFWPRLPSHLRQQLPVVAVLRRQGIECAFVACQERIAVALQKAGLPVTYTREAWTNELADAHAQGREAAARLADDLTHALPPFPAAVPAEAVRACVRRCFEAQLPAACEAVAAAHAMLDATDPSVFVVGNDITIEGRAGVLVARQHGTATACLMHGNVVSDPRHAAHLADRLLTYGRLDREYLIRVMECPEERVVACGAPYLDARPSQEGRLHPALVQRLGLEPQRPYVLVATSGPGFQISFGHHMQTLHHVMALSERMPGVQFVAKLHPKDRLAYYRQAERRVPGSRLQVAAHGKRGLPTAIFDWLQGCAAVLTGASTVAREAMLMDVPVVTMDFADEIQGVDFIEAGATRHVTTSEELEGAVRHLLESDALLQRQHVDRYLKDSFHLLDGSAARRCAAVLLAMEEDGDGWQE